MEGVSLLALWKNPRFFVLSLGTPLPQLFVSQTYSLWIGKVSDSGAWEIWVNLVILACFGSWP